MGDSHVFHRVVGRSSVKIHRSSESSAPVNPLVLYCFLFILLFENTFLPFNSVLNTEGMRC